MLSEVWSIPESISTHQISASSLFFHIEIMTVSCKGIWSVKQAGCEGHLYLLPSCTNHRTWPPCTSYGFIVVCLQMWHTFPFLKTCNTPSVLMKLLYISRYSVPTWGGAQRTATCKSYKLRETSSRYVLRDSLIGMHVTVAAVHAGTVIVSSAYTVGVVVTIFMCTDVYSSRRHCLWFWKKEFLWSERSLLFQQDIIFIETDLTNLMKHFLFRQSTQNTFNVQTEMYYATVNMNLFWWCLAHAVYITSTVSLISISGLCSGELGSLVGVVTNYRPCSQRIDVPFIWGGGFFFFFDNVSISALEPTKLPLDSHINSDWYGKDKVIVFN